MARYGLPRDYDPFPEHADDDGRSHGIRWLIARDHAEVLAIDRECFPTARRWTGKELALAMRQPRIVGYVRLESDAVIGFVVLEMHDDAFEVLKLAVAPTFQRQGLGRDLMDRLAGKATKYGRRAVEFRLPDDNLAGHLFLRSCGFRASAVERAGFGRRDAYVFRREVAARQKQPVD